MADQFDSSLLESPIDDRKRPRWGVIVGSVLIAAVVAAGAVAWLGGRSSGSEVAQLHAGDAAPTGSSVATTETTAAPGVVLWPYEPDPPLLYHPTLLPNGWEACRVVEDASAGDRFCDPQDPDRWVQVRVRRARDVRYDGLPPVGDDSNGVWVERGARNDVAYRRSGDWIVVRNDDTLPAETLVEIAASVPVVGDFDALYGVYEVPLALEDVSDDDLAALLVDFDSEPRIVRRDAEANVSAEGVSLYGFYADGYSVPDFAWQVPQPRLVGTPDDRPLIVGYSDDKNRAYAVWDQAGYGWRLEGRMSTDDIHTIAIDLIDKIGQLPTQ